VFRARKTKSKTNKGDRGKWVQKIRQSGSVGGGRARGQEAEGGRKELHIKEVDKAID